MQTLYIILTILISLILIRLLFRKVLDLPTYSGKYFTDDSDIENIMPETTFWQIIKTTREDSKNNYAIQCQLLTAHLEHLSTEEIISFDRTFGLLMAKSYSYKLWEPVYSLNGGCSDDMFEYFRSWLLAQGKNKFYWTIKYPRLLLFIGVKEFMEHYEGIAYCAYEAYEQKTGLSLPQKDDIHYAAPGPIFKESEALLRYPELALLAW